MSRPLRCTHLLCYFLPWKLSRAVCASHLQPWQVPLARVSVSQWLHSNPEEGESPTSRWLAWYQSVVNTSLTLVSLLLRS